MRDIEAAARLLGPALIVLLGGLIGLMMAGLLSGVTELGQAALNRGRDRGADNCRRSHKP
ncbi:hypothetical protein PMI01_04006, partial [Caulobacter sp. AP07]